MRVNRWAILGMLAVARLALALQFQSVGSIAPALEDAFGLDHVEIGLLVGLFMLPGVVLAIPGGAWGKRYGDERIVLIGMALMIAGGLVCAGASGYATLLAGRVLSGAGAAFLFVLMTKMLTDWFAGRELFLGMSVFLLCWPVGIAAAQASQAYLASIRPIDLRYARAFLAAHFSTGAPTWAAVTVEVIADFSASTPRHSRRRNAVPRSRPPWRFSRSSRPRE